MGELSSIPTNSRELKRLTSAVSRDLKRVPVLERQLAEAEELVATLKGELRQERRAALAADRVARDLEKALRGVLTIQHGKRTDRRLARAQRVAKRGLDQLDRRQEARRAPDGTGGAAAGAPRTRRASPRKNSERAAG
jgi:chromosome segregation ATPase